MKVLVDGYNLYLKNGTGISRYSRELCHVLDLLNHDIFLQFGIPRVRNEFLAKEIIFQKLSLEEDGSKEKSHTHSSINKKLNKLLSMVKNIDFMGENIFFSLNESDKKLLDDRIKYINGIYNESNIHIKADILFGICKKFIRIKNNKKFKVDIYHKPYPIPCCLRYAKNITTIHDIIPLKIPYSTTVDIKKFYEITKRTIERSDKIITTSKSSKNDIIEYFNVRNEEKISVAYQSSHIDEIYINKDPATIQSFIESVYGLSYKKYIIFYGAIEPKKNVHRIISAALKSKCEYPLVIAGKNGWLFDDVSRLVSEILKTPSGREKILRIPFLPFEHLTMIVSGAAACVFPSLYEGFGLPVLESMQLGCPVITSNISSLPEIGGDAVHYVDPYSVDEIANGIDALCGNEEYRLALEEKGRIRAKMFSIKNYAQKINNIYTEVAGKE